MRSAILTLTAVLLIISCTRGKRGIGYDNLIYNSGYIENREQILVKGHEEIQNYKIENKDVIADIGSGTGWLEGYFAIAYDTLTIYAEDIDKRSLKNLPLVVEKYTTLDHSSAKNTYHYVLGENTKSNLPDDHFDKIIVRETFHHFEDKDAMLRDLHRKLKCDGRICVYEPYVDKKTYSELCQTYLLDKTEILSYFEKNNFVLEEEKRLSGNPGNVPPWIILTADQIEEKVIYTFRKVQGC
jgi:ubiquinone/menaquinone biosynthesis C-methylase UbiE